MISCQIQMHIHISNAAQNDWFFSQFPDLHQNVLYRKWHELFEAESEYDCIILDLLSKYKTLSFTRIRHLFGHSWIPLLSDFEAKTIQYFVLCAVFKQNPPDLYCRVDFWYKVDQEKWIFMHVFLHKPMYAWFVSYSWNTWTKWKQMNDMVCLEAICTRVLTWLCVCEVCVFVFV